MLFLVLGTVFGFVLSRSGAADYDFIQNMFLFRSFQLYGIIGTAVVLTAPGLWALKRYGRTITGKAITIESNRSRGWNSSKRAQCQSIPSRPTLRRASSSNTGDPSTTVRSGNSAASRRVTPPEAHPSSRTRGPLSRGSIMANPYRSR